MPRKLPPRPPVRKPSQTVGERIKAARTFYRLTQSQLGRDLKITKAAVCQYEADQTTPRPPVFDRLARLFRVEAEWFMTGQGTPPRPPPEPPIPIPEIDPRRPPNYPVGEDADRHWGMPLSLFPNARQTVIATAPDHAFAPAINRGDYVLVDTSRTTPNHGTIFLVAVEQRYSLCRVRFVNHDTAHLAYNNPAFEPRTVKRRDIKIIGQVVGHIELLN